MTVTLEVQDNYFNEMISFLSDIKDKFHFEIKDKNLELDPYFYERQKELHQIKEDVESGKIEVLSHEDFWKEFE